MVLAARVRLCARVRLSAQTPHSHAIHLLALGLCVIEFFEKYLSVLAHHSEVLLRALSRCLEAPEFFQFCPAAVEERLLGAYLSRCCLSNQLVSPMTRDTPYTIIAVSQARQRSSITLVSRGNTGGYDHGGGARQMET